MPDDFDSVVADRCREVDDVPVPADMWSRVQYELLEPTRMQFTEHEASTIDLETPNPTTGLRLRRRWMLAAAAVLVVVVAAVVLVERDPQEPAVVTTNTPPDTTTEAVVTTRTPPDTITTAVESSFDTAIESAGLLISPSAEEIALASNTNLYQPDSASTQVSAADQFVSLRMCRTDSPCSTGWAYETGSVDGGEVHHGLLGEADEPAVYVLDDRFFVVMEVSPDAQPAPTTWLIDSLSGRNAELTWRDEPTTLSTREQALVVSDGPSSLARWVRKWAPPVGPEPEEGDPLCCSELFLPRVVDARDGTIRPLAVPDTASADFPVRHHGRDRIWIGTTPGGNDLGLAYSDDGGATWTDVALPAQLLGIGDGLANAAEMERMRFYGDLLLSVAADGDRIAVTDTWNYDDRDVYISGDSGLNWSTVTLERSSPINGANLYVLADQRLLLGAIRRGPSETSTRVHRLGLDHAKGESASHPERPCSKFVEVNRDGIVTMYYPVAVSPDGMPVARRSPPFRHHFSTDLTTWRITPILDDPSD